jgi:regulator of replication initiation timing
LDDIPTEYRAMLIANYPPRRDDDIDGWFDYFQREISNYKQAIRRVIQDVIQLREQHKILTAANSDLKIKIENFEKRKKVLYEIFEGDKIDKSKMQDIFSKKNLFFYFFEINLFEFI